MVDAEGKIARFVAITLRVCHQLVVLMYWTLGQRLLLLSQERQALIVEIGSNVTKHQNTFVYILILLLVGFRSIAADLVSPPRFR